VTDRVVLAFFVVALFLFLAEVVFLFLADSRDLPGVPLLNECLRLQVYVSVRVCACLCVFVRICVRMCVCVVVAEWRRSSGRAVRRPSRCDG
jgi:hypothetical protein